ncbi:MAG TPA: BamA/TamA family outer membrane protein, partial [Steroidobacteraceae bacterium]|nr:BamA/TamA family outer membrane protein [Steroidobacteraceae bacterium]
LPKGTSAQVKIAAELGPLFHIGRIDIEGELPESARAVLGLKTGQPAVAQEVLNAGNRMLQSLEDQGYAFAKVPPPVANLDPREHVLNIVFSVDTGALVNIGEIRFVGLKRVKERFLRRRLLLHSGERYSAAKVEKARHDLLNLGLFTSISVRLGEQPDAQGRVPVTFDMRERARHTVSVNAAYSTDLGTSGGVTWTDRNVFGEGQQLALSATMTNLGGGSATTGLGYDTSAKYSIPDFWHRDQTLLFTVEALRQDLLAYTQIAQSAGVSLSRKLSTVWSVSVGATDERETIEQEGASAIDFDLIELPLRLKYDSTDLVNPLDDPLHGMRAALGLTPAESLGPHDVDFVIVSASLAHYVDLHPLIGSDPGRSVLAMRVIGGVIQGSSERPQQVFDTGCGVPPNDSQNGALGEFESEPDLPPDQRFYAGGSGTIRGYGYQAVGPSFICAPPASLSQGNQYPIGGLSMEAINLEYRQRIGTNFGMAAFVDGGSVSETTNPFSRSCANVRGEVVNGNYVPGVSNCGESGQFRVGVGAGPRYYTPIGPIRIDIAVPINRRPGIDSRFQVYIGIGQAF